ncbi:STAS domain-containing protein [Gracilibacillus ureilyticus]|uniref:STAS domain-containing protein n=1 Tax=Gracilibacillus ureilyticus TaxID=531814 RepID=A0A1H9T0D2_9BACI|nr:STAS domain-containing protein [Gracilibacillus ureilyticus]SER90566.1 STAS domain-containing protein [Gracilibacillus ureilyticus]
MDIAYDSLFHLKDFFNANKNNFEETLLTEAVNVKDKIDEILTIGNIDLVNNAHQVVAYIINGEVDDLKRFAKKEGIAWASQSIELTFKLEWIQAIRRALWIYIKKYQDLSGKLNIDEIFTLETDYNNRVDMFLNTFFINYSTYKDALIQEQKKLVENLSVPIIPIDDSISILPLIGSIDNSRISFVKEKVLTEVSDVRIQTLIIDLSGILTLEKEVILELLNIINGISMMGCSTVLTGLRKEVVKEITESGIQFGVETEKLGTLQKALDKYLLKDRPENNI